MRSWISIKKSADFKRITTSGRKYVSPTFVLFLTKKTDGNNTYVGFTASRKVGNAVMRSRAKRRLRAALDECVKAFDSQGTEIIVIARRSVIDIDFKALLEQLDKAVAFVRRQEKHS